MLELFKYLDNRLKESGTWAALSSLLLAAHIAVDPGVWGTITTWGMITAGLIGVFLRDPGTKEPPVVIAQELVKDLTPPPPAGA